MSIRENLQKVEESIAKSAAVSGRKAEDVTLIAVSKTIDVERILEAYEAGARQLGENRVQEMMGKQPQLPPDIGWHLIGQLQKNKVKYIIDKVKLVHSLCSLSVAQEMQRLLEKRDTALDCLIEINIAGEETKSGLSKQELPEMCIRDSIIILPMKTAKLPAWICTVKIWMAETWLAILLLRGSKS